jgi:hypothetical protein
VAGVRKKRGCAARCVRGDDRAARSFEGGIRENVRFIRRVGTGKARCWRPFWNSRLPDGFGSNLGAAGRTSIGLRLSIHGAEHSVDEYEPWRKLASVSWTGCPICILDAVRSSMHAVMWTHKRLPISRTKTWVSHPPVDYE